MNPPLMSQITTIAATITLMTIWLSPFATARGGISYRDVASTGHIEELPAEIRNAVGQWQYVCGTPLAAKHPFAAHYLGDGVIGYRLISFHFHELSCDNRAAVCTDRGCLHQVNISTDGVYHLAFSANVPEVTLKLLDHTPAIEVDCETFALQCRSRILRWNGRRFVEP
jgi:hypothetical protein